MPVSEQTFLQLALEDPDGMWELHCGRLRSKDDGEMTAEHGDLMFELGVMLRLQLDRSEHRVRVNHGHLRRNEQNFYIPDVLVIPTALERTQRGWPPHLEVYADPLPLAVEVWSRSTGDDDREEKLPEYQRRGDLEIWRLHPYERWLTAWVRQSDGTYAETTYMGGQVKPTYLPDAAINLDALFASQD